MTASNNVGYASYKMLKLKSHKLEQVFHALLNNLAWLYYLCFRVVWR